MTILHFWAVAGMVLVFPLFGAAALCDGFDGLHFFAACVAWTLFYIAYRI